MTSPDGYGHDDAMPAVLDGYGHDDAMPAVADQIPHVPVTRCALIHTSDHLYVEAYGWMERWRYSMV